MIVHLVPPVLFLPTSRSSVAWANAVAAFLWRELHPAELAVVKKPMDPLWRVCRKKKRMAYQQWPKSLVLTGFFSTSPNQQCIRRLLWHGAESLTPMEKPSLKNCLGIFRNVQVMWSAKIDLIWFQWGSLLFESTVFLVYLCDNHMFCTGVQSLGPTVLSVAVSLFFSLCADAKVQQESYHGYCVKSSQLPWCLDIFLRILCQRSSSKISVDWSSWSEGAVIPFYWMVERRLPR